MSKPSLLLCGCEDGTCEQCLCILALDEVIRKTSVVYRDIYGEIRAIVPTRTVMDYKRLVKGRKNE